jgi:hypothetical protein
MFFEASSRPHAQHDRPARTRDARVETPVPDAGSVLATDTVVARSDSVSIWLPVIRAYRDGCLFDIEVATRQGGLAPDDWWDLRMSSHILGIPFASEGAELPRKLLRFGVRFADGTKVTTIDVPSAKNSTSTNEVQPHQLSWTPSGGSHRVSATGGRIDINTFGLWLSPLPPAEHFEFAVEWPLGNIPLSIVEIDGAAVRSTAAHTKHYWEV